MTDRKLRKTVGTPNLYEGSEVFSAGFRVFWKLIRYQGIDSFQTECMRKEGIESSLYQPLCFHDYYSIRNKTTLKIIKR